MQRLYNELKSNPVVYVTRDIERALGIDPNTEGYFIISNNSDFAKQFGAGKRNVSLLLDGIQHSTADILKTSFAQNFIKNIKNPSLLVFKNTPQIEKICGEFGWKLLNPPAEIAGKIEEKISQVKVFESLNDLFLKYKITECKNLNWEGKKFILQFNYSHTGSGTLLIDSEEKLNGVKNKFPEREARISDFIEGPLFTNNNVLSGDDLIIGNVSYQITGLKHFADKAFSTIGNDWGLAKKMLTPTNLEYYKLIVKSVAEELKKLDWKGLFGIDVVMDEKTGKMFLIEVNARQPASTTFESWLQNKTTSDGINIFEAHLAGLLGLNLSMEKIKPISSGSQIIKRIAKYNDLSEEILKIISKLKRANLDVIHYNNKNIGSELLRIQSNESFLKGHNELSNIGRKVLNILRYDSLTLGEDAQELIDSYINLEVGKNLISVPYFNNARIKTRGGLKVFTGKGNPEEIKEEISIISKKKKINLHEFNKEQAKQFLIENNIGIDCSGFAYYILDAELKNKKHTSLRSVIKFPTIKNLFRKIIAKLRVVQNTNVLTLAQDENSYSILPKDSRPGDFIVIINSGPKKDLNHIMVITNTETKGNKITYAHSFAWSADGRYNHGVRTGEIEIIDDSAGLLQQKWTEKEMSGDENETYVRAKQAKILDIRRLKHLTT